MMLHPIVRKIDAFEVKIKNITGGFGLKLGVRKVERETQLSLINPNSKAVLKQHQRLQNIKMNDMDKKTELSVQTLTHFIWVLMSPGKEGEIDFYEDLFK